MECEGKEGKVLNSLQESHIKLCYPSLDLEETAPADSGRGISCTLEVLLLTLASVEVNSTAPADISRGMDAFW